ncbi:P-loop containing nucleoside triphosphate hydrolase protein [Pelagophyceae sp. CCMP2097]|nr:P-loop containing nucleoside triphosphate hydrolase protein [Pelagophyceae sp. CCMP2097]
MGRAARMLVLGLAACLERVGGLSAPSAQMTAAQSWAAVGVPDRMGAALDSLGYGAPTLTQELAIPAILGPGHDDVIIHAPTGSGKTLAYLVPLLSRIDASRHTTQAVIFVPSRELGLQVAAVARKLAGALYKSRAHDQRVLVMSLLEGSQLRRQRAWAWAEPPHIIVGNAKEIAAMMSTRGVKCADAIEYVVVDEVDAFVSAHSGRDNEDRDALHNLLSDGFVRDLFEADVDKAHDPKKQQLSKNALVRANRQTVFASATIEQPRHFAKKLAKMNWCTAGKTPLYLSESSRTTLPTTMEHYAVACPEVSKRLAVTRRLLKQLASRPEGFAAMVFIDATRPVEAIRAVLDADAVKRGSGRVLALDSGVDLVSRAAALTAYAAGRADVLVVTDEASRGLDAPRTTYVINLDVPRDDRAYAHRAGRTARLGRPGTVLTVVAPAQRFALTRLTNALSIAQQDVKEWLRDDKPDKPAAAAEAAAQQEAAPAL